MPTACRSELCCTVPIGFSADSMKVLSLGMMHMRVQLSPGRVPLLSHDRVMQASCGAAPGASQTQRLMTCWRCPLSSFGAASPISQAACAGCANDSSRCALWNVQQAGLKADQPWARLINQLGSLRMLPH